MPQDTPSPSVRLTESAANRIKTLMKMEAKPSLFLRLAVLGGGCSGFQYTFGLEEIPNNDDLVFKSHDVGLIVDKVSLDFLNGAEVDYVEEIAGAAFTVRNPNAVSSCGCGSSFSPV